MKKQLWPGVVLGACLFLSTLVYAIPVRETTEPPIPNPTMTPLATLEATKPDGPYRDRGGPDLNELRARWNAPGERNNTEILAFTSTFAATQAVSLMQNNGQSLSFASFGRVPFYQVVTVTNEVKANATTTATARSVTALPEPATLLLLGSGLAALAAGLRKKKKRSDC